MVLRVPIPPWVFQVFDMLEEVEDTMTCSQVPFAGASYITFDKAMNLPPNWIAIGDRVMKVNPLFGAESRLRIPHHHSDCWRETDDVQVGSNLWHVNMQPAPPIDAIHLGIVLKVMWDAFKDIFATE
ncbi:hypothetical protein IW261DRAFT_1576576 [Armillaria novae-zelandiae]|uniref:Uncharacterized protein n=1 Tax=Armillaria novae-zelandiae TaxID=153914 RepID=A0AA39TPP8_9AGAR|nr:hypothetical protein IW261DRAFT_1576576 [Armillaria novae-zelandiae]